MATFIGKKIWIQAGPSSPKLMQLRNTCKDLLCTGSILCLDCWIIAFKLNILRNVTIKRFSFSYTLLKDIKSLKNWVNSVGINQLMKYNIPLGFSFDNNIFIITEKVYFNILKDMQSHL